MVPSSNSGDLARRLPNAELAIYPDAGHGGILTRATFRVSELL
jgi:pimeloyl-ACP methyl ester carboxylesterase